jgi:GAF domain-containing protein
MPSEVSTTGATQDLGRRVEELEREVAEAREQQAATSEILRVISTSPTDLKAVLGAIAENAARICAADDAHIWQREGKELQVAASYGMAPLTRRQLTISRQSVVGRAVQDHVPVHVEDLAKVVDTEFPDSRGMKEAGNRTILAMPLLRNGKVIGAIMIRRKEMRPFAEAQVALLRTFADQAVIAIENTRLFKAEQESKRELQESLEYQTATTEVLDVISRSPTNSQPVLDAIAASVRRLTGSAHGSVNLFDGKQIHLTAHAGIDDPVAVQALVQSFPQIPSRGSATARAILSGLVTYIPDVLADAEYRLRDVARTVAYRSIVSVPMLREGHPVGAITAMAESPSKFSSREITLLQTFANQAVIAINNAGLFEEVQARTRDLTEALEQQTATADVLKVISRSALDVQKVLDALVESAARLCDAYDAAIFQVVGDSPRLVAHHGQIPMSAPVGQLTLPLVRGAIVGRAVIDRRTIHVADILAEGDEFPEGRKRALQLGFRTSLAVPLVHAGEAIGAIFIRRGEVRPFTERQIELVNTFADQAVIAIENTRLFEQVQARTNELQRTLEYQTATSEVLEVIGRSPTDLQPVFDAIAQSAARLCNAQFCHLFRFDGQLTHLAAVHGLSPEGREALRSIFPMPPGRATAAARAILSGAIEEIPDVTTDFDYAYADIAKIITFRSIVAVPMIKDGRPIGAIAVARSETGRFPKQQIELLRTFADQAVIAIENTRLFEAEQASKRELQESLQQQTATAEVLKAISRAAFDLKTVLDTLVMSAARLCNADMVSILSLKDQLYHHAASYGSPPGFDEYIQTLPLRPGRASLAGRVMQERKAIQIVDALSDPDYAMTEPQRLSGFRTMLGVPLLRDGSPFGMIILSRKLVQPFTSAQIDLATTFADQAVIAIENTRLFEEVQARTRELAKTVEDLEIASQHKNQFVANMSHELRTPLAAILGYAELIQEGFYEPQGPKSLDALTRIRSNGKHLLGLINTVLDIAKIESGQFTLNMSEYAIESVVETVRAATESLAQNKKLALTTTVDKSLPVGLGDEQRLTQVLLNLVGNAIKFTDAGEVSIAAGARNGRFAVSVTDTGPGIPAEHQSRIFEQFQQVDSSNTRAKGGTGLGLAIAKQIVEMHGGRIWVESTVGKGSTFQMEIPARAESRKRPI